MAQGRKIRSSLSKTTFFYFSSSHNRKVLKEKLGWRKILEEKQGVSLKILEDMFLAWRRCREAFASLRCVFVPFNIIMLSRSSLFKTFSQTLEAMALGRKIRFSLSKTTFFYFSSSQLRSIQQAPIPSNPLQSPTNPLRNINPIPYQSP